MPPADVASYRYELCYGKSEKGSACAAKKNCACESSPERVTLGQLRFDAKTNKFSATYHLQCVSGATAANYMACFRANHPDEDEADAIEALLDGIKEEHRDDARDCLSTVLLSDAGAEELTDEQLAWLESLHHEPKPTKKSAAKKPAAKQPAAKKTQKEKAPTKRKAPAEKSSSAAKKETAPKKKTKLTTKSAAEAKKGQNDVEEETDEDDDASDRDEDEDDEDET